MDAGQPAMIKLHANKLVIDVNGFLMGTKVNVLNIHAKHMKIIWENVNIF